MNKYIIALALVLSASTVYAASYTTRTKDTLATVAQKTGMTVEQLAKSNPNLRVTSGQTVSYEGTTPTPSPVPQPNSNEIKFNAYITGYTFFDNTPPGTADIALPVIHSKAGGVGTFSDPITLAVGHVMGGGRDVPDYPAGTRFYFYNRYFIVEDLCGDGSTPQNGPCHRGYPSTASAWLDIWVDGKNVSSSKATQCAESITKVIEVIQNPVSTYPVDTSPICK